VRPHARRARRQNMPRGGGGVCVIAPPLPPYWRGMGMGLRRLDRHTALGRPMRPFRVCGGRRCVYHLEPPRASTSRCGHRPCRASRHPDPAHLRTHSSAVLPTCSADAHLGQRGHQGCSPRRRRVRRAVCGRACGARGGSRCREGGGGWVVGGFFFFFFLHIYNNKLFHTPCSSRLLCLQRPWRRRRRQQRAQHQDRLDARSRRSRERCEWRWRRRRRAVCRVRCGSF